MHLREKHANERHTCHICGAGFSQKRTLARHTLIHLDDKPFACDRCGYTCRRKQDLARHVHAMHSGKVRRKAHEERIADVLHTLQIKFTREYTIKARTFADRQFARIDFHINMPWGWLLFEVDEMAHCKYNVADECRRMEAIWLHTKAKFPEKQLHVIRYNPHAYKQDGVVLKPTQEQRVASIKESLAYVPHAQFVITYIYYRCTGNNPAITSDPGYTLAEFVRPNNTG